MKWNAFTGQVHVQFFGDEREHGWVGDKWLMPYKGLAAFEAKAELNTSMRVRPSRRAAWNIAVSAADQAARLDRLDRVHLLTYLYDLIPQKVASGAKKQKRSYRRKSAETSAVGEDKHFMDASVVSQDDGSPPRKKRRRKSSLPLKQDYAESLDSPVPSSTTDSDVKYTLVKKTVLLQSEAACGKGAQGKSSLFLLATLSSSAELSFTSKLLKK